MSFAEAEQLALLGSGVQALSWTKKDNALAEGLLCLCESAVNLVSVRILSISRQDIFHAFSSQASSGKNEQSWALPTAQQKDCGRVVHIASTGYVCVTLGGFLRSSPTCLRSLLCLSTLSQSCILWEPAGSIAQGKTVKLKTHVASLHAAAGLPAAVAAHDCGGISLVDASGVAASTAASAATAKKTSLQWCRVLQLRGSHRGNWIAISALSYRSKGGGADSLKLVVNRIRSSGGSLTAENAHAQDIQLPSACPQFSAAFNKAQLMLTVAAQDELHFISWPARADWFSAAATLVASTPFERSATSTPAALYAVEPSSLLVATADPTHGSMQLDMWNVVHRVPLAGCDIQLPSALSGKVTITTHKQLSKVFLCAGTQVVAVPFVPSRGALSQLVGCTKPAASAAGTPTLSFAAMVHHQAAAGHGKRAREGADWAAMVHSATASEAKRARELCGGLAGGQAASFSALRHLGLGSLGCLLDEVCDAVVANKCTGGHRDTLMSLLRAGSVSHALCPRLAPALLGQRELELLHAMLLHVQDLPEAFLVASVMAPLTADTKRVYALLGKTPPAKAAAAADDESRLGAVSRMLFQAVQCGRNDVALAAALRELDMDCTGILLGCLLSLRASSPAAHPGYSASLDWARLTIDAQLPRLGQAAKHAAHIKDCLGRWNDHVVAELSLCAASSGVAGPLLHVLEKAPVPAPVSGDYVVCADFF